MRDALPSGIGPSSQVRAAIAALSAHLAIILAAVYGTAQPIVAPAVTRRDTVLLELPTTRSGEGTEHGGTVSTAPRLPTAPPIPVLPLDQPAPTVSLSVAADAGALAVLREAAVAVVNGEVVVEYVIDRNVRVQANSIRTMRSDHPAFTRSVREALLTALSDPAGEGENRFRCWCVRGSGLKLTAAGEMNCLPKVSWGVT
jgi:hypothetical protein